MNDFQKKQYNSLVKRYKEAERFMDDNTKTIEEREKWIPQLQGLLKDMHDIAKEFKLTKEEIENGIK